MPNIGSTPEAFVRLAIAQAEEAARTGNRPFGAVIVGPDGTLEITERNRVRDDLDPTSHAEMNAIRGLCRRRRMLTLDGCVLYANAQPCPMCFGAIVEARIAAVHFGAPASPGIWPVPLEVFAERAGPRVRVHSGVLQAEAIAQLARLVA